MIFEKFKQPSNHIYRVNDARVHRVCNKALCGRLRLPRRHLQNLAIRSIHCRRSRWKPNREDKRPAPGTNYSRNDKLVHTRVFASYSVYSCVYMHIYIYIGVLFTRTCIDTNTRISLSFSIVLVHCTSYTLVLYSNLSKKCKSKQIMECRLAAKRMSQRE